MFRKGPPWHQHLERNLRKLLSCQQEHVFCQCCSSSTALSACGVSNSWCVSCTVCVSSVQVNVRHVDFFVFFHFFHAALWYRLWIHSLILDMRNLRGYLTTLSMAFCVYRHNLSIETQGDGERIQLTIRITQSSKTRPERQTQIHLQ